MKKKFLYGFLSLGWVLFLIFLLSSFAMNHFTDSNSKFTPISWDDHLSVFMGTLSCALTSEELITRKKELKEEIFPKIKKKEELETGFVFYFDDETDLAEKIMEFIAKEKQCCPFFQFDLSILPFGKGLAFRISGSKEAKDFLVANGMID